MTSIFVSYSSKDISHVNSVNSIGSNNLSKNIDLWIATQKKDKISQLKPGEKWRDEIEKNINSSSGAILLVSKNFLDADIITNFELPLIIKKKKEDPNYKIYPLLIDECDYKNNSFLSSLQFSNSPNTFLISLSGKRYQLEVENLINHINEDFPQRIKKNFILLGAFIASLFVLLPFLNSTNENINDINTSSYIDIKTLGINDCFNIETTQDKSAFIELIPGEEESTFFYSPYFDITEKISCKNSHHGQIISKNVISRTAEGTLILPGPYLGITVFSECAGVTDTDCEGVKIKNIEPGSPADFSALLESNIIRLINGVGFSDPEQFYLTLQTFEENDYIDVLYSKSLDSPLQNEVIKLEKNIDNSDREGDIYMGAFNHCFPKTSGYGISNLENFSKYNASSNAALLALPILDYEDRLTDEFSFYCALFYINDTGLGSGGEYWKFINDDVYEYWEGNLIEAVDEAYGFDNYREFFTSGSRKYEMKNFKDIKDSDCLFFTDDFFEFEQTDNTIFPIHEACDNETGVNMQFFASFDFSLNEVKLLPGSDEFNNYINTKCRDQLTDFELINNPVVAKSLFADYFDWKFEQINTTYWPGSYWQREGEDINVKCAFMARGVYEDEKTGLPRINSSMLFSQTYFSDLFNHETNKESSFEDLDTGFLYCPEELFIGDGYYVENNFKSFSGDRTNLGFVVAEWFKGEHPITNMSFATTSNGVQESDYWGAGGRFGPEEGWVYEEKYKAFAMPLFYGEEITSSQYPMRAYENYVNISLTDYPYLQELEHGAVPILLDLNENYSGPLEIRIWAKDLSGAVNWTSCETNVVKNPTYESVLKTGKEGVITSDGISGESQYIYEPVDISKLEFPKLINFELYGNTDKVFANFDINTYENSHYDVLRPNRIWVELSICTFPNESNCIKTNNNVLEVDKYGEGLYRQMLHFMSVQPSLYEEVDGLVEYLNIPYKLYWENGIYKYRNVPLEYVTCNKAYVDIPEQSDVYSLDLDCLKNDYTEIALLLKSFTFNTYGRAEDGAFVECEVTYTGFTDPDRTYSFGPEGQSIQISSYLSGCNWQSLSSLPTDDGNMQYVPLFDYSTVTDMDLYNGTPFILINP